MKVFTTNNNKTIKVSSISTETYIMLVKLGYTVIFGGIYRHNGQYH